jgi:hypothetical protein
MTDKRFAMDPADLMITELCEQFLGMQTRRDRISLRRRIRALTGITRFRNPLKSIIYKLRRRIIKRWIRV